MAVPATANRGQVFSGVLVQTVGQCCFESLSLYVELSMLLVQLQYRYSKGDVFVFVLLANLVT